MKSILKLDNMKVNWIVLIPCGLGETFASMSYDLLGNFCLFDQPSSTHIYNQFDGG